MDELTLNLLIGVVSTIAGGGLVAGIVALLKVRPETNQILVSSAKDVVVLQRSAITDLQNRLAVVEKERDDLRGQVDQLREEVAELRREVRE